VIGDVCGAGDRFAASLAGEVLDGAVLSEAVVAAVSAASSYVGAGGPATLAHRDQAGAMASPDGDRLAAVRAAGGTVVATGGCFDLLHAGHVELLQRARQLGDVLVVLLNSDRSVRELKGPNRPVVAAPDRAAVLRALGCVDAVVEFDERTPEAALARLQPDLFVKGGDYGAAELPEQTVMSRWGGQCVVLPYLDGRSTTTLFQEVIRRGLA
jgi:rfaE bifunctional protein nucleotidyltransferase chain/domain